MVGFDRSIASTCELAAVPVGIADEAGVSGEAVLPLTDGPAPAEVTPATPLSGTELRPICSTPASRRLSSRCLTIRCVRDIGSFMGIVIYVT